MKIKIDLLKVIEKGLDNILIGKKINVYTYHLPIATITIQYNLEKYHETSNRILKETGQDPIEW